MLEKYLIEHCSPTLASLKTANLFNLTSSSEAELEEQIDLWNQQLKEKGITLLVLRRTQKSALVYVCRLSYLQADLNRAGVADFLRRYGYECNEVHYALRRLKARLQESEEFPHEIGIFLSYPLGDVIGFIENAGKNSKCTGCWKVYCNECEAVRLFERFKKCHNIYKRLWQEGRSIMQLTVAA